MSQPGWSFLRERYIQGIERDEQRLIQGDDKIQNSEDIHSMITDNSNEGDDIRYKVEGGQEGVSENVIEKEIPLVGSYNEDIKDVIEQNE
jgi:hypothetical protein